ncbi:hypothetical protein [Thalassobacter stenotrophicus]|uniref:hypothetical protein n=1 Tax=Thalassobacter stenotrophicus TaxID=266809 RepID=UPI002DDCBA80|nr:hypothetical protein [Thalassobacter stenotrophicus]
MVDIVDAETRSRMMAGMKGKNTKPELALRQALHARGLANTKSRHSQEKTKMSCLPGDC